MASHVPSVRARLGPRFASLLIAGGVTIAIASCGSRTGLFGPESAALLADASADAETDGAVPCIPGRFTFELALTQLMFVLDRSGSMRFSLDGRTEVPRSQWRWTILQNALRKTIVSFDQQIAMGAKFFPEVVADSDLFSSERSCRTETGVGIAPARGNANLIVQTFEAADPRGGTPTAEAVRVASEFLTKQRSVARTLVVATDGAPNCNGDLDPNECVCTASTSTTPPGDCQADPRRGRFSCLDGTRTIETIRQVAEVQKIPVYVIGIGSTERPDFLRVLDDMAIAGGRPRSTAPRHYNVQSENDLTDALATIRDSVAKCTYLTPSAPTNPDDITVELDGKLVARDPTKTNGWDWIDKTFGWLAFFGDACAKAQGSAAPSVATGVVSCGE